MFFAMVYAGGGGGMGVRVNLYPTQIFKKAVSALNVSNMQGHYCFDCSFFCLVFLKSLGGVLFMRLCKALLRYVALLFSFFLLFDVWCGVADKWNQKRFYCACKAGRATER